MTDVTAVKVADINAEDVPPGAYQIGEIPHDDVTVMGFWIKAPNGVGGPIWFPVNCTGLGVRSMTWDGNTTTPSIAEDFSFVGWKGRLTDGVWKQVES